MEPVLLAAEDGESIAPRPGRTVRVLYEHELLDASYASYDAGERGAQPHIHLEHVDAFYVLEGEVTFRVGPKLDTVRAGAGTFLMVPPGLVHAFDNDSDATARWLNFHAPSTGFLAWLRGERESFDQVAPPADGGRPVDDAVVVRPGGGELFERHNRAITILGDAPQFSALEIAFDDSFAVDPHTHDDHADSFLVLEGEVDFTVGERVERAGPETWLTAPPNARHGFRNGGTGRARVLNVHTPDAGFAAWIRGQ
jgi:quercetin dioxygenase-like cupin family protein